MIRRKLSCVATARNWLSHMHLIKIAEGTTIVKNLRVCEDCHTAAGYISEVENCRNASCGGKMLVWGLGNGAALMLGPLLLATRSSATSCGPLKDWPVLIGNAPPLPALPTLVSPDGHPTQNSMSSYQYEATVHVQTA